jgi:hypothetical protein
VTRRSRILAAAAGVVVIAAAGVTVALVTRSGGSSAPLAFTNTVAPARTVFPAPPPGSVVFAREDRGDVLALGALAGPQHALTLQVSDVGDQGTGVDGLRVAFAVRAAGAEHSATAAACGAGCYRSSLTLPASPTQVRVTVRRPTRTTTWNVTLPAPWPATDATALIARADRVWRGLTSVSYEERLASDATHAIVSQWQITAPDRLAYQIAKGSQAVIIGLKRWDRAAGGSWQESSSVRLDQPQPFWVRATDAHVVGSGTVDGHAVWRISFYDPRTPGWFVASVEKTTAHTLDLQMFATAHFMHDSYHSFDVPNKIVPPSSN